MKALLVLIGLMLLAPLALLVLMGILGLIITTGSSGTPGLTTHFTFATLGELSINNKVVVAGWMTQVGCVLSAILGFYLFFRGARPTKRKAIDTQ